MLNPRHAIFAASTVLACAVALTGCVNNVKSSNGSSPSSSNAKPMTIDAGAAALLPESVKSAGTLVVGINLPYPPNEYKDPSGTMVGWEVEFFNGVAATLGLQPVYKEAEFSNIIPSVKLGQYDVGMSSLTDTRERQAQVSFVDYYRAGSQWASPAGKSVDPDNACGLTVAVVIGTTQQTDDLPLKSKACVAAGKKAITMLSIESQDVVNQSVILGQADAFDADSPVTQYAVHQSHGKLQLAGEIYGAAPYGLAISNTNTALQRATQKAIQAMLSNGSYQKILTNWGVQAGAVTTATIDGAQS